MKRYLAIAMILVVCGFAAGVHRWTKVVIASKFFGLSNGKQTVACFQDRPGIFSIGFYRSRWSIYPAAVSIDKRGVYLQTLDQRNRPRVKSFCWE